MKKIILSVIGICALFLSCENDSLNFQDEALQEGALSSASLTTSTCTPDLDALELSLPDMVTVKTKTSPCSDDDGSFITLDIAEGNLAGLNNAAWCADLDGGIAFNQTYTFDVYSSYEDLSGLELSAGVPLFENANDFDKINWLLNQDIIGTESPMGGTYTFGHVQWAIWEIIEGDGNNCTNDCDYLSCNPINQWDTDKAYNESLGLELIAAAEAGEGFVPQCGQQIAIVLASKTIQSLIILVDVPEKIEECSDCDGNVTELKLQYNGDQPADIVVKTKDEGENGSKIVFEGNVAPGGMFSILGNDENGTLGKEIKVYIDGDYVKIKTNCEEPIGPGLIKGDIEVISGTSLNGGDLCPIPCDECKGGVTSFTFEYTGNAPASLKVEHKDAVLFDDVITPGQSITLSGSKDDGKFEENNLIFTLDGNVQSAPGHDTGKIHMSCSKPFYVGLPIGDSLVVTAGTSKDNGEICPIDGGACDECDGGITSFTFEYTGMNSAMLKVEHKDAVLFDEVITPGQLITLSGSKDDGKFEENNLIFKLDGNVLSAPEHDSGKIHMSCSKPFYVGLPIGDSLVVISGTSKDGGPICEDTPPMQPDCQECDGKVTRLDLQYNGTGNNTIKVVQKKDNMVAFSATVAEGEVFTFSGKDDKGTLGTEIIIYVNGVEKQRIHTSCSVEIGAGAVFGDFTVIGGASRNGGELCPVDTPSTSTECDCDGKIVSMAVEYAGPNGATVTVGDDEDGNNSKTFTNVQAGDILNVSLGEIGNWWYWSVNGNVQASIHTSCSDDILGNVDAEKSDFGNLGSYPNPEQNNNNGTFLVVSHTDNSGNTCTLDGYTVVVPPIDPGNPGSTECDCDGKIVEMSVAYEGPNGATITVGDDEDGNNSKTYLNVQNGDILTASLGEIGNWWYWSVNGNVEASIHTSCSDDILGNVDAHKSNFGDLGSFPDPVDNDNNGTFLVVSHTDNKGNTCSILVEGI